MAALIEAQGLTKDYGDKRAVDGLSFTVQPGIVTGFLGPNGSGKSTTMRLILGLDRAGSAFGPHGTLCLQPSARDGADARDLAASRR